MKRIIRWLKGLWTGSAEESVYGDDFGDSFGFKSADWGRKRL